MLNTNQMANLDSAKSDIYNKKMILDTAIDIQALLRILAEKEIITREEVSQFREEVRKSPKYNASTTYIKQTLAEIETYEKEPELLVMEMYRKMQGK